MPHPVQHNPAMSRFESTVDDQTAVADYRLQGRVMTMTHTVVPSPLRGRGIAADLVRAAFEHARAHGLRVEPQCAYVQAYMAKHPDTEDLRA